MKKAIKAIIKNIRMFFAVALKRSYHALAFILPKSFVLFIKQDYKVLERLGPPNQGIRLWVESNIDIDRAKGIAKEPGTARWVEEHIKEDSVFYDIGANVGVFSLLASKKNKDRVTIYAFEPSFTTFRSLVFNIIENNCQKNITPFMAPLSSKTGKVPFYYQSLRPGDSLHAVDQNVDYKGEVFAPIFQSDVISYAIDDLVFKYGYRAPTHMKIDVDGVEYDILQGASEVLRQGSVRSIIVELCQKNPKSHLIEGFLKEKGYHLKEKLLHIHRDGNKTYTSEDIWDAVFER